LAQELFVRAAPELGKRHGTEVGIFATLFVVGGWTYFILTGNISTIWPMFGIANQLLACTALCVGTTILLRENKRKVYALCTLLPLAFVGTTTISAGVESVRTMFWPMAMKEATRSVGLVNVAFTSTLLVCVGMVIVGSMIRWIGLLRGAAPAAEPA
jgi:carbon starvation protein